MLGHFSGSFGTRFWSERKTENPRKHILKLPTENMAENETTTVTNDWQRQHAFVFTTHTDVLESTAHVTALITLNTKSMGVD